MRTYLPFLLLPCAIPALAQQPRHFLPPLVAVATIGGESNDVLVRPMRILADSDGVVVAEADDWSIRRFGLDGKMRWKAGRPGAGPGEFRRTQALRFDAAGNVWVLDPENARVTILDPRGGLLRTIALRETASEIEPVAGGKFLTDAPDSFLALRTDSTVQSLPVPPEVQGVNRLARQAELVRSGSVNAAVFGLSDLFYLFDDAGHFRAFHGVEPVPFPVPTERRIPGGVVTSFAERPTWAAISAAAEGDSLYILFAGKGDLARRLVDVYSMTDGRYLGTYQLPQKGVAIAMGKAGMAVLTEDPVPMVTVYRRAGRAGEAGKAGGAR